MLGDLVTSNGCKLAMKLKDKKGKQLTVNKASCIVRSEEITQNNDEFIIQFRAQGLPMGWYIYIHTHIFANSHAKYIGCLNPIHIYKSIVKHQMAVG